MIDFINDDIRQIIRDADYSELPEICDEIRKFLLDKVSQNGGHLASNLGIVELTVALHRIYDTPTDKIIYDVGHQSYVHKIITGRAAAFDTLRKYKGLSGFPKSHESQHDSYDTGHSSTSISAAAGMAVGRDIRGKSYNVVAVIGDGSMTGGLTFEALNNIGSNQTNVKIILNDNDMSIARNVGALSKHLQTLRSSENYKKAKTSVKSTLTKVPFVGESLAGSVGRTKDRIKYSLINDCGMLFEELGIKYFGPYDGHDIRAIEDAMRKANAYNGPTIVHFTTRKGKGYYWSEKFPRRFHGVGPFDIDDGKQLSSNKVPTFSEVFGKSITALAEDNPSIVAVCAAMGTATGLGTFYNRFPERYFDVGIAEEHAVVFSAGMAKAGLTPVVAIYSSFLQRAIDQIIEDVCLQNLHVIFAIDRAGLVGADGETHHGQFDLSYLAMIPNMTVLCPADGNQLSEMLKYAISLDGPVAIRYPRGAAFGEHLRIKPFAGYNQTLNAGKDITILPVGTMLDIALNAAADLRDKGYDVGLKAISVVKPFDESLVDIDSKLVVTIEDNVYDGGFGEHLSALSSRAKYDCLCYAIPDRFIEHGSVSELRHECGLTAENVINGVEEYFERKA